MVKKRKEKNNASLLIINDVTKTILQPVADLRSDALLFNAGCNNKCFLLNPEKKIGADPSCRFREKRKKTLI